MSYLNLKQAEEYLNGAIKSRTLLKYINLKLVDHFRIGVRSIDSKKDTRPIAFTEKQLDELMQKFLIKNEQSETSLMNKIFQKSKHGGKNA